MSFVKVSRAADIVYNYDEEIKKGDVLVVNNTRVMPARLMAQKDTGAVVEILLLKRRIWHR